MKLFILAFSIIFLAGCQTYNVQSYEKVDSNNKSMTVPPGSSNMLGEIKRKLHADGWKIFAKHGPTITKGTISNKIDLEQYKESYGRYELSIDAERIDLCLNFIEGLYVYDISVVDNLTGKEVLTLSGRACEHSITDKFINELKKTEN